MFGDVHLVEQPTLNYEGGTTSFTVQVNVTGQLSKTITVTIAVTDVSRLGWELCRMTQQMAACVYTLVAA